GNLILQNANVVGVWRAPMLRLLAIFVVFEGERLALLQRKAVCAAGSREISGRHVPAQPPVALAVPDFLDRRFVDIAERRVGVAVRGPVAARLDGAVRLDNHFLPRQMTARSRRL